jgi:hypothetical protein
MQHTSAILQVDYYAFRVCRGCPELAPRSSMKPAIVMALRAAVVGSPAAAGQKVQTASTFCAGLKKAVAPHTSGADAVFIRSYEPSTHEATLPAGLATTAFVYDNALAAIALIACGNVSDARPIGNALSRAVRKDRSFDEGRVRNAYRAGAVIQGVPDLPGWWDGHAKIWAEDSAQDGTSTGNVAWAALALLTLYQATHDPQYLAGARRLIDWVIEATASPDGFYGGFHGYDPKQVKLTWMSTEHNADPRGRALAVSLDWRTEIRRRGRAGQAAARSRLSRGSFLAWHEA